MKKRRRCNALAPFCCTERCLERRRSRRAVGCISAATISQVLTRTSTHPVELCLLIRIQQSLDLRVRAVAYDASDQRDGIELRPDRFIESDDLAVLLLDQRIDRRLLRRREIELARHLLPVATRTAHLPVVAGANHAVGSKAERAAGDKSTQQKHQRITLGAIHLNPQCDKTYRNVASRCDEPSCGAVTS